MAPRVTPKQPALSFPHQNDCNTRMDISNVQQNIEQLQTPTMRITINKMSTKQNHRIRTDSSLSHRGGGGGGGGGGGLNALRVPNLRSNPGPQTGSTRGNSSLRGDPKGVVAMAVEVVVEVDKILSMMLLRIHLYAIPLV